MSNKKTNTNLPWFIVNTIEEAKVLLYQNYLEDDSIPIGYCGFNGMDRNDIGYGMKPCSWS